MKLKALVSDCFFKSKNTITKYSPEILLGVGIAGFVATVIVACKETTKLQPILEDTKEQIDEVHTHDEEVQKKELTTVYIKTAGKIAKNYLPAFIIGTGSVLSVIASNGILNKRNAALAAAYSSLDSAFRAYKEKVKDEVGDEKEEEIRCQTIAEEHEKTGLKLKPGEYSRFSVVFDEGNPYYKKDASYNRMFLEIQQAFANNKLIAEKRLPLNEVYKLLGFEPTKEGQILGWTYDPNDPSLNNFVDFGIYNIEEHPQNARFINGREKAIILDFNVDGNILDKWKD